MMKKWWKSKTVWANILALVVAFGIDLREQEIVAILAVINLVLRAITKEEIVW
ncbi:MAG TPA: hypothetical protein VLH56_07325 [Dissulfurispiraceae bacterium]|nr:hypothetical protein [Dissulfurispiraceae bacterium]